MPITGLVFFSKHNSITPFLSTKNSKIEHNYLIAFKKGLKTRNNLKMSIGNCPVELSKNHHN
jgi:hypothetical protein